MKKITALKPLDGYCLYLRFDDGEQGEVDLATMVDGGVFAAWLKPGLFEQAGITETGAVGWPEDLDLCADALYLKMTQKSPEEIYPHLHIQPAHA